MFVSRLHELVSIRIVIFLSLNHIACVCYGNGNFTHFVIVRKLTVIVTNQIMSSNLKQPLMNNLSSGPAVKATSSDSTYKHELADNYDFCMVLPVDPATGSLQEKGR